MALDDLELSLMAFPQRWDSAAKSLSLNILILPVGDPTDGPSVPLMRAHHHPDGRVGMIAGENVPE